MTEPRPDGRRPAGRVPDRRRRGQGGRRRVLRAREGRDARGARRVGLRQDGPRARGAADPRLAAGPHHRRRARCLGDVEPVRPRRGRHARGARRAGSRCCSRTRTPPSTPSTRSATSWSSSCGSAKGSPDVRRARQALALLERVGIPSPRGPAEGLPASALRRDRPARDGRDGRRARSRRAARGRADLLARRDGPGAGARTARHAGRARPRCRWC